MLLRTTNLRYVPIAETVARYQVGDIVVDTDTGREGRVIDTWVERRRDGEPEQVLRVALRRGFSVIFHGRTTRFAVDF